MRYYRILFSGQNTGNSDLLKEYSSIVQGPFGTSNNTSALEIEFDLMMADYNNINQGATLKIRNAPIKTCIVASQYTGMAVTIYAGFSDGLQSAFSKIVPNDYGLPIAYGTVLACVPNYVGTEMNIDFLITHVTDGNNNIAFFKSCTSFTFSWKKNQNIVEAITNTIKIVDSKATVTGTVSSGIVTDKQVNQMFTTLEEFSAYLQAVSQNIIDPNNTGSYSGIKIAKIGQSAYFIYDNQTPGNSTVKLQPHDFIGQPLLFSTSENGKTVAGIQATLVLRGDMALNKMVTFPNVTSTQALSQIWVNQQKPIGVSGRTAKVTQVRHIGRFRSSSADQWATIITCVDPKILEPNQT